MEGLLNVCLDNSCVITAKFTLKTQPLLQALHSNSWRQLQP